MTSKEIVLNAVNHIETGKLPVDFGSTAVTGMHVKCVAGLRKHYGLENKPVRITDPYQMLGEIDDELAGIIGIDTTGVNPRNTMFGFPNENWKEWRMLDGLVVLVAGNFNTRTADDGSILIYPEGDLKADASAKMPANGYFFDTIIRQETIDESKLDPKDNLEEFEPISDEDLYHFEIEAKKAAETGKAVVATFGGTAFGDIALVPAPFLKKPKGIRDIEEWYISTIMRRDYIKQVFDIQCETALANLDRINKRLGQYIDIVFICGTDFGTQDSAFCSTDDFSDLYMPYYKKINSWIHDNTVWKTMKHSCGAVSQFIPQFIESGFDILNPVQCSAAGMDAKSIKAEFGNEICFWGGGVDTQQTLQFGNEVDVYNETIERCQVFSKGGGFVFNAIHNIQANTPVRNIVSMIKALNDFR